MNSLPNAQGGSFAQRVAANLDARGLLAPGETVLLAISGGADSVALLEVMTLLAAQAGRGYRLAVAHLNHLLRDAAGDDESFVRSLAEARGLECLTERLDVAAEARNRGESVEQAGRRARYEFFLSAARRIGARAVATAHHADDNVETILYRIVRGTHLRGLAGIPAVRRLGGSNVRLVRPLLEVTRAEIEAFLRARNLAWRQDSTNADTLYRRNFIRNELLPLLRNKLNARADDALLRLSAAAAEAEEFLAAQAGELLGNAWRAAGPTAGEIDLAALGEAPPILRRYVVRGALERVGAPLRMIGAERLMQLGALAAPGGSPTAVTLPGGFRIRRVGESLRIEPVSDVDAAEPLTAVTLCVPGVTDLGDGRSVICEVEPFDAEAFRRHCLHRPDGEELLDADAIRGRLLARGRQRGDAFVPLGCPGRQTVSDFLTNAKLPRTRRDRAVCISDETGLVYLAPLRIDDRVKVTAATRRVLRLRLEEIEDRRPTAPARTALPS